MMFILFLFIPLAVLIAVIAGLVSLFRSSSRPAGKLEVRTETPATMRRLFTYIMAFAGLISILYAAAGLLSVVAVSLLSGSSALVSADDLRSRASFYLAAFIVGVPLWLGAWRFAQRRAVAVPEEHDASERRLFFATVFAVTSVMILFAGQALLQFFLTLPGPALMRPSTVDGIGAAAQFMVYGITWLVFGRLARAPGEVAHSWWQGRARETDGWHDVAVYVVAGFALAILANGIIQALRALIGDVPRVAQPVLVAPVAGSEWTIWGGIMASLIVGGLTWAAIWRYDTARGGQREWRVLYLYLVLVISVPATLGTAIDALYELLRRAFGYQNVTPDWSFLQDTVPFVLVGGGIWIYHWLIVRRQADVGKDPASETERGGAGIPWPRRPGLALLNLAALATAVPAFISILWLVLDFMFDKSVSLSGPDWWRDRLSLSIAAGLIGLAAWGITWSELQRAASASPVRERAAQARRLLIGAVLVTSTLTAIGFTIAVLWLVLQALLGVPGDASTLSTMLKDLSTAIVMVLLAAYYGLILRHDMQLTSQQPASLRLTALVVPGAEEMLAALRTSGHRIDVKGFLVSNASYTTQSNAASVETLLTQLSARAGQHDHDVLLVVYPDSVSVLSYTKTAQRTSPVQIPITDTMIQEA